VTTSQARFAGLCAEGQAPTTIIHVPSFFEGAEDMRRGADRIADVVEAVEDQRTCRSRVSSFDKELQAMQAA
jgi:hypothetical protein